MNTGLTDRLQETHQGLYGKTPATHYEHRISYTETFDQFCEDLCATDLLNKDQKQLMRGLIWQWLANKKRG